MNRQTRDVMVLSGLVVVLVGVGLFQMKGMKTPPPKPKPEVTTQEKSASTGTAAKPVAAKPKAGQIAWVEPSKLGGMIPQVKGGRDPFKNYLVSNPQPPTPTYRPPVRPPTPTGPLIPSGGETYGGLNTGGGPLTLPDPPSVEIKQELGKTLKWTTLREVESAIKNDHLDVVVKAGKFPNQIKLTGYQPDFDVAVTLVDKLDVEPPIPTFVLTGVITTNNARLAAISVDGKYYTLMEGESMPDLGWTVIRITPSGVTLTKGKQSKSLRLSGGSQS